MTKQSRRKFSAEFKAKVALEAIKNEKSMAELGHQFEINPVTISKWKNEFLERMLVVFENGATKKPQENSPDLDQLYAQIGQLKVENDFFPDELRAKLAEFVDYYNNQRYHEALGNVTPTDVYFGRAKQMKIQRHEVKMKTLKERRKTNRRKSA